jgi:two-component system nitrogen regulation sensor histidine kinase GlnL
MEKCDFSALDWLSTAVMVLDPDGNILRVNIAAQTLLEQSEKKLRKNEVPFYIEGLAKWLAAYRAAPHSTFAVLGELTELQRPQKSPLQIYASLSVVPEHPDRLVLEIMPAQGDLQQNQEKRKVEVSENSRKLLRNLAHEIKNPLGGIRGAAQLLELDLRDPEEKEYTQVIISEADRLQHLVDKILEPYRTPFQPKPVNIHEILERVRLLIESEFPTVVRIERDYDISAPEIMGDKGQLTQVFLNLVRNAVEAILEDGCIRDARITLRTRVLHHAFIGVARYRSILNVRVIDNGPGIPEKLLESIFYPLITGKAKGSGLGLSMVQAYVEQHSGSISVESRPGNTDFSVLFPLAK